jgi:hypothetical protein
VITGWLSGEDCPDCGGPLLDTSDNPRLVTLECPGCGYRMTWPATGLQPDPDDANPADPGDKESR